MSETDYCVQPSSSQRTGSSGSSSGLPELVGYGGDPASKDMPLGECEGDCDGDNEVSSQSTFSQFVVGTCLES